MSVMSEGHTPQKSDQICVLKASRISKKYNCVCEKYVHTKVKKK